MNPIQSTVVIMVLAFLAEAMTEYILSPILDALKVSEGVRQAANRYAALAVGVGLSWLFDLDLFSEFLGLEAQVHYVAVGFSGLVIGRGSNFVHDVFKRIREGSQTQIYMVLPASVLAQPQPTRTTG